MYVYIYIVSVCEPFQHDFLADLKMFLSKKKHTCNPHDAFDINS